MIKGAIQIKHHDYYPISIWVYCPYCDYKINLIEDDIEDYLLKKIYSDELNFDKPYTATCHCCEQEFDVDGLEY